MNTTITKEFKWDCAHRLFNPKKTKEENKKIFGPCYNIHGHSYKMFVTVSPISKEFNDGMVINFKDLKEIITKYIVDWQDHTINLTRGDPLVDILKNLNDIRINVMNNETTCENQVKLFWDRIEIILNVKGIRLEEIKLYETATSYATLKK